MREGGPKIPRESHEVLVQKYEQVRAENETLKQRVAELEVELAEAKLQAEKDHLTGIRNRAGFEKEFTSAFRTARHEIENRRGT